MRLLRVVHYGFDHWVFEPNFLSFLYIFILAYVTSRVLRPPWGHEIRRHLWQSSLEQAFADWLKYSHYYVFSYGRYFWKHLISLAWHIDVWWIFEFGDSSLMMLDSSFWLCIKYPHWDIFPPFSEVPSCCWMISILGHIPLSLMRLCLGNGT